MLDRLIQAVCLAITLAVYVILALDAWQATP